MEIEEALKHENPTILWVPLLTLLVRHYKKGWERPQRGWLNQTDHFGLLILKSGSVRNNVILTKLFVFTVLNHSGQVHNSETNFCPLVAVWATCSHLDWVCSL